MKKSLLLFTFVACSAFAQVGSLGGSGVGGFPNSPSFATVTATATGSVATPTIAAGVNGDGAQHTLRIYGLATKSPVLSLFESGSNEGFAAVVGGFLVFGQTNGLADFTDSSLLAGGTLRLAVDGTLSSVKACATNYTRIGPNYCMLTTGVAGTTIGTTCTTIAAPAGAKAVVLQFNFFITGSNTVGALDISRVDVYNDNGACTTSIGTYTYAVREFAAQASTVFEASGTILAPVVSGNASLKRTDTTGTGSLTPVVSGYFD